MAGDILADRLKAICYDTDTLRSIAGVYELRRRDVPHGPLRAASDISVLAAQCIRIVADLKDLCKPDPNERIEGLHNPNRTVEGEHVEEFVSGKYLER